MSKPAQQPLNKAFLLAATHSGAGKTTLTLGLLAAMKEMGLDVQPFKCGPDFIDPTLHKLVTGKTSRNLDIRMCGRSFVRTCFSKHSKTADISLIEGVMGLFDGADGSGATLAKELGVPVVLIVDTRSCAESIAAIVKGFESLDPRVRIAGVILNRVASQRHIDLLKSSVKSNCQSPVIGTIPRNETFTIPERHLGLFMGDESPLSQSQIKELSAVISDNIDLEKLLENIGEPKPSYEMPPIQIQSKKNYEVRIAVARDEAFCFYYQDNFDILETLGAELTFFSPLHDSAIPKDIHGIYLGGGYPELFAEELSKNQTMLSAIQSVSRKGMPIYAECGGFMYLTQGIRDLQESFWPMAKVFPVKSTMQKRLSKLGYRVISNTEKTSLFGSETLYGHEFHYSSIEEMPNDVSRAFKFDTGRLEGYLVNNTLGTYLHQHFGANPTAAENFINFCNTYKGN